MKFNMMTMIAVLAAISIGCGSAAEETDILCTEESEDTACHEHDTDENVDTDEEADTSTNE
jgi:hypothetical protein